MKSPVVRVDARIIAADDTLVHRTRFQRPFGFGLFQMNPNSAAPRNMIDCRMEGTMRNRRSVFCLAALALAGCSARGTRDGDIQAIKDNEARWNQEFAARNIDKLVDHYAEDAILMGPGMPSSSGKPAIRKMLAEMVADPALSLHFQAARVEVARAGDWAYTQGTYQMAMTDPVSKRVTQDHGSYVTTYAKQPDGSWKAATDIATSEMPPLVTAAAQQGK
jgi:uncharacterized protein (TIGR02246 family)